LVAFYDVQYEYGLVMFLGPRHEATFFLSFFLSFTAGRGPAYFWTSALTSRNGPVC